MRLNIDAASSRAVDGRRPERGQALVLVALSLVALIGLTGLVIDGGNAYVHRRQQQNAADAGALAGTRILQANYAPNVCGSWNAAVTAAQNTAVANGAVLSNVTVVPVTYSGSQQMGGCNNTTTMGLAVSVSQPYGTYFARVLGINQLSAGADATAAYFFVQSVSTATTLGGSGGGVLPLMLANDTPFTYGPTFCLQPANSSGPYGTSPNTFGPPCSSNFTNFASLDTTNIPGQPSQTVANAVANGVTALITAGVSYPVGSVSTTDPTILAALKTRYDSAPSETCVNAQGKPGYATDSKRVVTVYIKDSNSSSAPSAVLGFATVFIVSADPHYIGVCFIKATISPAGERIDPARTTNPPTSTSTTTSLSELTVMKLIR